MRVGIYGGSFDPVHIGHVAVVVALSEAHFLDVVYIVPTSTNPHKNEWPQALPLHRIAMLKKAFRGLSYCKILTLEAKSKTPSFTIDTIFALKEKRKVRKQDSLFFLMGEDLIPEFHLWKRPEELVELAQPLVARRAMPGPLVCKGGSSIKAAIKKGLTDTPLFDVSATEVRERLASGRFCGHLLQESVLNYINKQSLYNVANTTPRS
jgi:nicotinate-nucleotide adenylyltransferase